MNSKGWHYCDLPLTFRQMQRHSNWSYTNRRIIVNDALWFSSPVLQVARQIIVIRQNCSRMCSLDQSGGLINEQQEVTPMWLVFDFLTSTETLQLILCKRKDHNKWCPLARLSSALGNKAKYCDPEKWRLHLWVRVGWRIDQWTAGCGTTVTWPLLSDEHRDTTIDPTPPKESY